MANGVDRDRSRAGRIRAAVEEELRVDVQGRGVTTWGQDRLPVIEGVTDGIAVAEGPNQCVTGCGLIVGEPRKPIVRLMSRFDLVFQTRIAGVVGLVNGDLEAKREVEFDVEVAVPTPLGEGDVRSDGCAITSKGENDIGPIGAFRNLNTTRWAPAAGECSILDIYLGKVDTGGG